MAVRAPDGSLASLRAYARVHLAGAGRLIRFDPAGLAALDTSWQGARLSFLAAILAAPAFALLQFLDRQALTEKALATAIIAYVMQWTLLPLAMFYLCRQWKREALYPRFIVALNWMTVWQSWLYAILLTVAASGILPEGAIGALSGILLVYLFAVEGFIAQQALAVSVLGAVGIVILDLFLVWQIAGVRSLIGN